MPAPHSNTMSQRGLNTTLVESGRIINVDIAHWTVDVVTVHSQRKLLGLQVGASYLHFGRGEGIYVMPEVGSKVKVCIPSDSPPFILCFVSAFERENAEASGTTTQPVQTEQIDTPTEVTYRAGRPRLQQGDIMLRCRDGNQLWLHRGGVVEIGSTGLSKRFYIPLTNMIRDVCENYEFLSPAGDMYWTVHRADQNASGDAQTIFTLECNELAQDKKATIFVQAGYVDDTKRFRMVIAPKAINFKTGVLSGNSVFLLDIDKEGSVNIEIGKDLTALVHGNFSMQIDGSAEYKYNGGLKETISGSHTEKTSANHEMEAVSSYEKLSSGKTIQSPVIKLGGDGATTPVILGTPAVLNFLMGHTHGTPAGPSTPPTTPVPPTLAIARKVYGE
jgi:hypothetical protein